MTPKIFNLHLSDETTSLYFLMEGFSSQNACVSTSEIYRVWNSTESLFKQGLRELEERNVISRVLADNEYNGFYSLVNDDQWRYAN